MQSDCEDLDRASPLAPRAAQLKRRRLLGFLFKLVFSAAILALVLKAVPLRGLYDALTTSSIPLVLLALTLQLPALWLGSRALWRLARGLGLEISTSDSTWVLLISSFHSLWLPGSMWGALTRWYALTRRAENSVASIMAVGLSRVLEMAATLAVGLVFALPEVLSANHLWLVLIASTVSLALFALYVSLVHPRFLRAIIVRMVASSHLSRFTALGERLSRMVEKLASLSPVDHAVVAALLVARNLWGVLAVFVYARALGLPTSIWELGWIRSVVSIVTAMPISISGLGVREGTLVALLDQYGVAAPYAVALSLLLFFHNTVYASIGGVHELVVLWRAGSTQRHEGRSPHSNGEEK